MHAVMEYEELEVIKVLIISWRWAVKNMQLGGTYIGLNFMALTFSILQPRYWHRQNGCKCFARKIKKNIPPLLILDDRAT